MPALKMENAVAWSAMPGRARLVRWNPTGCVPTANCTALYQGTAFSRAAQAADLEGFRFSVGNQAKKSKSLPF
jgi:hypothetical protein